MDAKRNSEELLIPSKSAALSVGEPSLSEAEGGMLPSRRITRQAASGRCGYGEGSIRDLQGGVGVGEAGKTVLGISATRAWGCPVVAIQKICCSR